MDIETPGASFSPAFPTSYTQLDLLVNQDRIIYTVKDNSNARIQVFTANNPYNSGSTSATGSYSFNRNVDIPMPINMRYGNRRTAISMWFAKQE